jgi:hypothetical protein
VALDANQTLQNFSGLAADISVIQPLENIYPHVGTAHDKYIRKSELSVSEVFNKNELARRVFDFE